MSGVSARQGGHQVAQKLIQTGRPRKSLSWTSSPSRVRRLKLGASRSRRGAGPVGDALRVMACTPAALGRSKNQTRPTIMAPTAMVARILRRALTRGRRNGVRKRSSSSSSGMSGGSSPVPYGTGGPSTGNSAPPGVRSSSMLPIAVKPPEEQVAVVGEEGRAEPQDEEGGAALAPPAAQDACVQVGSVQEQGHERGGLLGIPAPVGAPGDVSPQRAEDNDQRHHGEAHHDRLVADLVQEDFLGQPADGVPPLDQKEHGGAEGDGERPVGDDGDGHVDGEKKVVLERRNQRCDFRRYSRRISQQPQGDGKDQERQGAQPVLELEVQEQSQRPPAEGKRELVHVGEGAVAGGDGGEERRSGEEGEGVEGGYRPVAPRGVQDGPEWGHREGAAAADTERLEPPRTQHVHQVEEERRGQRHEGGYKRILGKLIHRCLLGRRFARPLPLSRRMQPAPAAG